MKVVDAHEGVNEAIARLNVAIAEWTAATDNPDDWVNSRPKHVQSLPDAEYGTVAECDEVLRAVDDRIRRLSEIEGSPTVESARDEALVACRDLRRVTGEHRGRLAVADDEGD